MTFAARALSFTFTLNTGTFASSNSTQLFFKGLRATVNIEGAGGPFMGTAHVKLYGLTPSQMSDLAYLQRLPNGRLSFQKGGNFFVAIAAGTGNNLSTVFSGMVVTATYNLNNAPDSCLELTCQAAQSQAMQSVNDAGFPGRKDAMGILATLAAQSVPVLQFENSNNLSVMITDQHLRGSLYDQIRQVAQAANVEVSIELGTLAVWPRGGARKVSEPIVVSAATGMIGYPTNEFFNLAVETEFNQNLFLGQQVKVQSTQPFANGLWGIFYINHDIESETPDGKWTTTFRANSLDLVSSDTEQAPT